MTIRDAADNSARAVLPKAETLVSRISNALRRDIEAGVFQPGDRLPSESELTRTHAVSRSVVREAIAILRSDGLVEARKGAGVFALARDGSAALFNDLTVERVSAVIELLELRSACEIRSAALAATRRSAAQIENILRSHEEVGTCLAKGAPTRDADFCLHLAIAEATQNRRFPEFLRLVRPGIIPRAELQGGKPGERPLDYNQHLQEEHAAIVDAIIEGNAEAAAESMQAHLQGSLQRYRLLLRSRTAS
ncbi:FadR/GntR family transcriptional regulator [Chelativorans alearense]|uniref:FadR/GntR family transcriptional regulator n=1 Tax=Chelativorans alearense TaxID=2681495 RepID=UPI0013D2D940